MGVQTLPTGVFGPLPVETSGFLLGRSSSIVKGLQIYSGVINHDYEGEIKIIAASPHGVRSPVKGDIGGSFASIRQSSDEPYQN
jgi:dUTPase